MLICVFPPHYQLVYISFDISSFSVISYRATRENLHTDINLFSPVYKFCRIRMQVFLQLFRPAFRLRHGAVYIQKKKSILFSENAPSQKNNT